MQGILYEEASILQFLLITVIIGGWTGWRIGKSVAEGWRGMAAILVYTALLGVGIRFVHHALFQGTMFSLQFYLVDTIVLLFFATIGFRFHRTKQMSNKYYWLYRKTSPFSWKSK